MSAATRILLIDDDAVDRMRVRRALAASDLDCELIEAVDGTSGLARAREATYDCVLLDYRLPDLDAFDLLRDLQSPECGSQAVMMLTGEVDPEAAVRLMRMGALDHLAKGELTASGLARAIRYATARRSFLAELEAARRDAEEKSTALDTLNRQKSLLLSIIAHDLRNPFQILLGLSEVLSNAVAQRDVAAIEKRARGIRAAAKQAHALMEGLFGWASLQMDSVDVAIDAFAVDSVVSDAIGGCQEIAAEKGVRIVVETGGAHVRSNRDMLAAILRNLVSNAIKFTPQGGEVAIRAAPGADVLLSVTDTGVGMDAETLANLFRLDARMTTPGTAGEKGSGLGLLLCRDLAERLGTEIAVTSAIGTGTSFSLRLPRARGE